MFSYQSNFSQTIKTISISISTLMTVATLFGALLFTFYCIKINTFPQHLSLSDAFLFLLVFLCFSLAYALFVGSMISLGLTLSLVLRPLLLFIARIANKKIPYDLARFSWVALPFALVAPYFIFGLAHDDKTLYAALPLMSIAYYFFYSTLISSGKRLKASRKSSERKEIGDIDTDYKQHKNAFIASALVITMMPCILPWGPFLDGTMRLAQLRLDHSTIYTKEPYSTLMPKALATKSPSNVPHGYNAYSDIKVLLRGTGNSVAIEFQDEDGLQRIDIPNDFIIIKHPRR